MRFDFEARGLGAGVQLLHVPEAGSRPGLYPKSSSCSSGEDSLTSYQFNTGTARHLFCKDCGVKSFYVPRSHPNGYSINARCLDDGTVQMLTVTPFNGKNWEESAAELEPLF